MYCADYRVASVAGLVGRKETETFKTTRKHMGTNKQRNLLDVDASLAVRLKL